MKRKLIHFCLTFMLVLPVLLGSAMRGSAQAGDPYSLIDAVNNLRVANGLPSYQTDGILMSIAQAHSDYQAAIGDVTHTGAGGTRPDRPGYRCRLCGWGIFLHFREYCWWY